VSNNQYPYVDNRPTDRLDPLGLQTTGECRRAIPKDMNAFCKTIKEPPCPDGRSRVPREHCELYIAVKVSSCAISVDQADSDRLDAMRLAGRRLDRGAITEAEYEQLEEAENNRRATRAADAIREMLADIGKNCCLCPEVDSRPSRPATRPESSPSRPSGAPPGGGITPRPAGGGPPRLWGGSGRRSGISSLDSWIDGSDYLDLSGASGALFVRATDLAPQETKPLEHKVK
jgi:hypothetical protein